MAIWFCDFTIEIILEEKTQKVVKIAENLSKSSDEGNMEQEEDKVLIKKTDFVHAS